MYIYSGFDFLTASMEYLTVLFLVVELGQTGGTAHVCATAIILQEFSCVMHLYYSTEGFPLKAISC